MPDSPPAITLHAVWRQSRLHLWGERGRLPLDAAVAPITRLHGTVGEAPAHLPAALSAEDLHAIVGEISPDGLLASVAEDSRLALRIPCIEGVPLPSPPAGGDLGSAPSSQQPELSEVTVPTLAFHAPDAIDLLLSLPPTPPERHAENRTAACPGISYLRWADSLGFWRRMAELVVSLLARQQFVPDVEPLPGGGCAGRWRVFVRDRRELAWLERYAAAMPVVCRSVVGAADPDKPDTPSPSGPTNAVEAIRIVDNFLLTTADALIRRILANDPFYEQMHRRAADDGAWGLAWLSSLVGHDSVVRAASEDDESHVHLVRTWISRIEKSKGGKPPALRFALVEPEEEGDAEQAKWRVRFDLRTEDGQTLDLGALRTEADQGPTVLGRHLVNRYEHLLAELARAAESFPVLRSALARGSRGAPGEGRPVDAPPPPAEVQLTTAEAHAFINEWGPMLRAQGYGLDVPSWAERSDRRLGIELFVAPAEEAQGNREVAITTLGLSSMLTFDWRVAVGDEQISAAEFKRIASSAAPLVKVRGHWVSVDRDAVQKALEFMGQRPGGRISLAEAIRLASGAEELDAGLPVVGLRGASWIEQLLAEAGDARMESLPQPVEFRGTLRPYQRIGLDWLHFLDRLGIGACLADDMGLGKTIQLIALLLHERSNIPASNPPPDAPVAERVSLAVAPPSPESSRPAGPTLLFAPMSVVGNWEREIARFAPDLRVLVHHGPDRLSGTAFVQAAARNDVVITTYGLAQRDYQALSRIAWHRIALDEAQKIKNPSANQTIAIRSLSARHRLALTGTPIENHLSELWSIMEVLNPGLMGSAASFRTRFAVPIEKLGDRERAAQLRRLIRPFVLRRLKSDPKVACDLPDKMEMRVYCNLTPEQAAHYERMVDSLMREIDAASGIRRRGLILATLTRLKQVCNHPAHLLRDGGPLDGRSGKCERLVEMLEEVLEANDAALVFTQFREMGELLRRLLADRLRVRVPFLHGGTTAKERDRMTLAFQAPDGEDRIFLLSLKAGGFGLNLTRANHVFHFDRWWNPAVEEQATDRAHRIGQTRQVQVHKFVCIGTIEDRIDQMLAEKAALADQIVGSGEEWLTGLSTSDLREYLRLSHEAIAEE